MADVPKIISELQVYLGQETLAMADAQSTTFTGRGW